jgi:hypothetical protein
MAKVADLAAYHPFKVRSSYTHGIREKFINTEGKEVPN